MPYIDGKVIFDDEIELFKSVPDCTQNLKKLSPEAWQKFFSDCIGLRELGLDFEQNYKNYIVRETSDKKDGEIYLIDTHLHHSGMPQSIKTMDDRIEILNHALMPTIYNTALAIKSIGLFSPTEMDTEYKPAFHEICQNASAAACRLGGKNMCKTIKNLHDIVMKL